MPLMCSQDGYQRLFSYSSRANSTNLSCFTDPMDSTICTDSDITTAGTITTAIIANNHHRRHHHHRHHR